MWRHQQSIVTSSAKRTPNEWDTVTMCKDRRFDCHLWIRYVVKENNVCTLVTNFLVLTRVLFLCVYFPRCFATREINTKITILLALKQLVTWVYTSFFISRLSGFAKMNVWVTQPSNYGTEFQMMFQMRGVGSEHSWYICMHAWWC